MVCHSAHYVHVHVYVTSPIKEHKLCSSLLCKLMLFGSYNSGLSVGFLVAGSIQKVGGYFHFISPVSCVELTY